MILNKNEMLNDAHFLILALKETFKFLLLESYYLVIVCYSIEI